MRYSETTEEKLRKEVEELKRQLMEQKALINGPSAAKLWHPSKVTMWSILLGMIVLAVLAFLAGYVPLQKRMTAIRSEARTASFKSNGSLVLSSALASAPMSRMMSRIRFAPSTASDAARRIWVNVTLSRVGCGDSVVYEGRVLTCCIWSPACPARVRRCG